MASDIYVKGVSVDELAKLCILCGFTGVGLYRKKGFVHVDVRKGSAKLWSFTDKKGRDEYA